MESIGTSISQVLNTYLKNKMPNQIIEEFQVIKKMVLDGLDIAANSRNLAGIEKEKFVIEMYHGIKINGIPLPKIEEEWEKINSAVNKEYKNLAEQLNKMNIFPQRTVKIFVENKDLDINIIDTGKKYIPNDDIIITEEIIKALDYLWNKENTQYLTNIFLDGHKALNLNDEQFEKIKNELMRRIHENANTEIQKNEEFSYLIKRTH